MKKIFLVAVVLCVTAYSAVAQKMDPVVSKIIEISNTDNQTMNHLDVLSNRFGGRLIGSDAYENASEWILSKFKEWGVEAYLEEAGTLPVGFNRGPWFGRTLGEETMNLHFVTPSYTSGTKGVQKGHVLIEPKTKAEFDRMKGALKGAWVLITGINSGYPVDRSVEGDQRRAKIIAENLEINKQNAEIMRNNRQNNTTTALIPLKDEPALFYKEMVEAGILGVIQSSTVPLRALYDKKTAKDPTTTFDNLPTTPDIKLDEHQYKKIYQWAKERRSFELEFDIRNHFKMGPVKYYNVIGKIKGSKYPDEYVMLSGHLDAFDVATGGVDCGVGVTPAMEAARLMALAGAKPKRSVLFVMFAGEEFGLLGATAWVNTHEKELGKIVNLFNRDGGPTVATGISVPNSWYEDMVKVCAPVNKVNPDFPFEVKISEPRTKPNAPGGTDASVFAVRGIPTIGFNLGDTKGYNFNYGEIWHTERDTYTKSIPEYQNHVSIVNAIVAYGIANLDKPLPREGVYKAD